MSSSPPIPVYAQCQGCRGLLFKTRIGSCGCLRCFKCYSCADHPEASWKDQPQVAELVKAQFPLQTEALEIESEFRFQGSDKEMLLKVAKEARWYANEPARLRDVLASALSRQVVVCHAPLDLVFYPKGAHLVSRTESSDDHNHLHVIVMPDLQQEEEEDEDKTEEPSDDEEYKENGNKPTPKRTSRYGYLRKDDVPKCQNPNNIVAVLEFIHAYPPHQYNRDVGFKDHPQVAKWLALPFHDLRLRSPDPVKSMSLSGLLRKNTMNLKKSPFNLDRAYELMVAIRATCREPFSRPLWLSLLEMLKELRQHCSGVCVIPEVLAWMPEKL